jgi:carbon storage regulator
MLVLTRRPGESIRIGDDVSVHVVAVEGKQVRISIDAPKRISVHRDEVYQAIQRNKVAASG